MTYDETTLFTKFMQGKGVMNNFDYLYRSHKFDKRDLDTYLSEVAAEDVILSAFDFSGAGNTIFGFKYWKDINEKWQAKLTEFRNTGILTADEAQVYCPHCQRVLPRTAFATKSNGVLHKHCRECEGGKWDKEKREREKAEKEAEKQAKAIKQLEKEIAEKQAKLERLSMQAPEPEPTGKTLVNARYETARQQIAEGQANLEKTTKVCGHCGKRKLRSEFYASDSAEDGLQEYCKTCQTELLAAAEETQRKEEEQRKLEIEIAEREAEVQRMEREQKALEEEVRRKKEAEQKAEQERKAASPVEPDAQEIPTAPRLGEHDATLHYKATEKRITLNAVLSEQVRQAGLTKCYIYADRKGHQFLVFNNAEGSNVTKATSRASDLLQVCSASICRQLADHFELRLGDNYYLHITKNLARTADIINVEVKQVRSREEYAVIVAQREAAVKTGRMPDAEPEEEETVEAPTPTHNEPLLEFFDEETHTGDGQAPTTGESGGSPAPTPEPKRKAKADGNAIPLSDRKPQELIQQLIDRGHLQERDIAAYLYNKGWELHEPVIVKKHKKFSV
ncbi:MAG: hypothetical protein IJ588_14490 [Prevotella sp.]|nr:hypothetical protein [Prevotella sp.]